MPDSILVVDVQPEMKCPHQGSAKIAPSQTNVLIGGKPIATMSDKIAVVGCTFTVPGPKPQPCVTVQWAKPSVKFLVAGKPAALVTTPGPGPGVCQSADQIPGGPPIVNSVQLTVIGT